MYSCACTNVARCDNYDKIFKTESWVLNNNSDKALTLMSPSEILKENCQVILEILVLCKFVKAFCHMRSYCKVTTNTQLLHQICCEQKKRRK